MHVYRAHQIETLALLVEAITKGMESIPSQGGDEVLQILPYHGTDDFEGHGVELSCGPRNVALGVSVLLQPFEAEDEPLGQITYLRRMDEDTDPTGTYRAGEVIHRFTLKRSDTPAFVAGKLLAPILSFFETEKFPDHPFA